MCRSQYGYCGGNALSGTDDAWCNSLSTLKASGCAGTSSAAKTNAPTKKYPTGKPTKSPTLKPTKKATSTPTFWPSSASPTPEGTKSPSTKSPSTTSPTTKAPTTKAPTISQTTSAPSSPTISPTTSAPSSTVACSGAPCTVRKIYICIQVNI